MSTETFTIVDFKKALPEGFVEFNNLVKGEHCFYKKLASNVEIIVRSSIGESGVCAGTAKDSIRIMLYEVDKKAGGVLPITKKTKSYVTRVTGWEHRMKLLIEIYEDLFKKTGICKCGRPNHVFEVVRKDSPNIGRHFSSCPDRNCVHKVFSWID